MGSGNLFFYEFSHRPPTSTKPAWIVADHGEDAMYTFGMSLVDELQYKATDQDKKMARMILKYWANFAKTG